MALPYNDQDITSADGQVVITCDELYPNGIVLQQFSTDAMTSAENVQIAETRMGVDGYMAAGVTPAIVPVTVNLEANSPSRKPLDTIFGAQQQNRRIYRCSMLIKIPATGESYLFSRGCMQAATSLPAAQRVLAPVTYTFHFERFEKV